MKYHALFTISEKAAKFEIVVCGAFRVTFHGLAQESTCLLRHITTEKLVLCQYAMHYVKK